MYHKQTDFKIENENIYKYGCLFFSLMTAILKVANTNLIKYQIKDLYTTLVNKKYMDNDCYVLDHNEVGTEILRFISILSPKYKELTGKRLKYIGALYAPNEKDSKGNIKKSWFEGDYKEATFSIIECMTENSNSHFKLDWFDPYYPAPDIKHIRSVRYYKII